jgi:two-component system sensor histidine kinase PilS (NtrC family)
MAKSHQKIPVSELSGRLQTLMLLRVALVSLLLSASVFIQIKETQTYFGNIQTFHYFLFATVYFLTFIYAIIFKYSKNLFWFAYFQLCLDTLFITAVIYATGGIESIFSFLYILTIINGSIILYRKGGMIIASLSIILYGLLLDLHYYNIIHPLGSRGTYTAEHQSLHLFYLILVNIIGFYLVAYLSGYLSEQTRKSRVELKAKQIDFYQLEILNESIINSISSALIALDGQYKIMLFNPSAEKVFGITADRAAGQKIELALPSLREYLVDIQSRSNQSSEKLPPFIDIPYSRPSKEEIHLRFSISPLRLPFGDQNGLILIFQDMTEVKRIEQEMKKVEGLALIGELAAGVAHEVRNPLASISASIQMLKDGLQKDNVNRRLMHIISREIKRLNRLVNDFLLFARPKKSHLEKFDLNDLVLESLELFKNSHHWTGKIKVLTDFQRPIRLESDPEQIKQVFWNVLLNACDAMSDGGSLYVATDLEPDPPQSDRKRVKIVFHDTGRGFDEKVLSQLFTPFLTTKANGSGLGLAIVKRIVEELQGEVLGDNHPNGGAEITILLPQSPLLGC